MKKTVDTSALLINSSVIFDAASVALFKIDEYNTSNNTGWKVEENENYIIWGIDQEWATITCDENFFNSQPSYIILRINY